MKNLFNTALFTAAVFAFTQSQAQNTHKDSSLGHKISQTATKAGHKTSEIAANGAALAIDKKYDGKYGPEGQSVYINKYSHYYYIDKKGHRVYLKKSHLRDKPLS